MSCIQTPDYGIPTVDILGIKIHALSWAEAMSRLEDFIKSGKPHHVVTVNPEFVMLAQKDMEFRDLLNTASLAFADGIGLLLAAKLKGEEIPDRVTGTDSVERLAELSSKKGYRLYFLGAAPGVAEQCIEKLSQKYPGMVAVGSYSGSPAPEEEDEIVEKVRKANPDVLFVAYGAPKQDQWIRRNLEKLDVQVCMGIGGAFDFHAGIVKRAPKIMQKTGTEWVFRLAHQPTRAKRMATTLPQFFVASLKDRKR